MLEGIYGLGEDLEGDGLVVVEEVLSEEDLAEGSTADGVENSVLVHNII